LFKILWKKEKRHLRAVSLVEVAPEEKSEKKGLPPFLKGETSCLISARKRNKLGGGGF